MWKNKDKLPFWESARVNTISILIISGAGGLNIPKAA
jgi:hypothetical protein